MKKTTPEEKKDDRKLAAINKTRATKGLKPLKKKRKHYSRFILPKQK